MKVELVIDGKRHAGQPEGQHVVVDGASCPTCGTLDGVVDSTGHVVALAASSAGMRTAMRDNPGCKPQAAHEAGPLRVFSDEQIRHERTIEGRAICKRCRHVVGTLYLVIEAMGRANVGRPDDLLSAAQNLEAAAKLCLRAAETMRAAAAADGEAGGK